MSMETTDHTLKIAVVDDHRLYRSGLVNLIHSLGKEFEVIMEAPNGKEFLAMLSDETLPDLVILDLDMPVMNGFDTAKSLAGLYPGLPLLIISMLEDEASMIRMLKVGVRGYLSKDVEPDELKTALLAIASKGYHYTDVLTGKLIMALSGNTPPEKGVQLNDRELQFLELCCSEFTYKEIADQMFLSPKTIDGYRAALFEKLDVRSRVGLVLYAIRNRIFNAS